MVVKIAADITEGALLMCDKACCNGHSDKLDASFYSVVVFHVCFNGHQPK